MREELIVLCDDNGNPIGTAPKLSSHNQNTPLHLAFSCYVFNQNGDFLLTQRALSKKTFPRIWTNSCCGHPAPEEDIEDAIKRRLRFELGLIPIKLEVILPKFRYKAEMNGVVENEICPVYIALVDTEPKINLDEVEDYKWIGWGDFLEEIEKNPNGYSYWSIKQTEDLRGIMGTNEAVIDRLL